MPQLSIIQAIQRRVARVAIGPSTVRGQGASGVVEVVADFLAQLPLRPFGVSESEEFRKALDSATCALVLALPGKARSWGLARKCLNIFLRDAFYNRFLAPKYGLVKAESYYEVPLDSVVTRELRRRAGRGQLPQWPGVRHLTPQLSNAFQSDAQSCSEEMGISRVHLDTYLWVEGR